LKSMQNIQKFRSMLIYFFKSFELFKTKNKPFKFSSLHFFKKIFSTLYWPEK
jgi:hypothetical protein